MYTSSGSPMARSGVRCRAQQIKYCRAVINPPTLRRNKESRMKKFVWIVAAMLPCVMGLVLVAQTPQQQPMSFFVTSKGSGDGANLSGVEGADYLCQTLADAVGSTKTWHAYLSTRSGDNAVTVLHARDRIGKGPWYNAKGQIIAKNVADLHGDTLEQARMGNN